MANRKVTREECQAVFDAVRTAIQSGYRIGGTPSALAMAAKSLNIDVHHVKVRLKAGEDYYDMVRADVVDPPQITPIDPVQEQTRIDRESALKTENTELKRRIASLEADFNSVLKLTEDPPKPVVFKSRKIDSEHGCRCAVLCLSDLHFGETVNIDEMDGLNSYSPAIARKRIERLFRQTLAMLTVHFPGWPKTRPDEIIVWLGGDLISGDIHLDLETTNELTIPESVKDAGQLIAGGLQLLAEEIGAPIRVYVTPGNHGRSTLKPRSKLRSRSSFDLLVSDFAEVALRASKATGWRFIKASSPDVLFNVYNWRFMATHGDTMGSGGGQGFIGPAAPITRGHRKLMDTALRTGKMVHCILTGHFHSTMRTTFGYANGSIVGYGEYARDLRADPEPAKQNLLIVERHHGIIAHHEIYLGSPDEGSLYGGPTRIVRE